MQYKLRGLWIKKECAALQIFPKMKNYTLSAWEAESVQNSLMESCGVVQSQLELLRTVAFERHNLNRAGNERHL